MGRAFNDLGHGGDDQPLSTVIDRGLVRSVYQPIVDLGTEQVVGFEALARGPEGPLAAPVDLFAAARSANRIVELDAACRAAALRGVDPAGIRAPATLFINVEPEALERADLEHDLRDAKVPVVLEITERALASRPADLIRSVSQAREMGCQIALDDIGVESASLSFMPLLRPDVVKMDMSLVQNRPGADAGATMNAVNAYCERTGALLLAEGIETERHLMMALALGAGLGQGYFFGRPSTVVHLGPEPAALILPTRSTPQVSPTPFAALPADVPLRRSPKRLLVELSKQLEGQALRAGATSVIASTFQRERYFTPATGQRYARLAAHVGFVAAIGAGMPAQPAAGVRGAAIGAHDRLADEWDVVVTGPHVHVALLARDMGDDGPEADRMFEYALTYRADVVADALQSLLTRIPAQPAAGVEPSSPPAVQLWLRRQGDRTAEEAMAHRALAASTSGVCIVDVIDPAQPIVYANAAFASLAGTAVETLLGQNCRILQGPETDPKAVAHLGRAIAQGRECRETLVNYRTVGSRRVPWWNDIHVSPVHDSSGQVVQYIGVQNDVTSRVEAERTTLHEFERAQQYMAEIETLAYTDPLTGLSNRRRVEDHIERALKRVTRSPTAVVLWFLDLDDFKRVNDGLGHAAGDELLREVGRRLEGLRGAGGPMVVARLGGDEFMIVDDDVASDDAVRVAEQVQVDVADALCPRVRLSAGDVQVAASVGYAIAPQDGEPFEALLHAADQHMYSIKRPAPT